MKKYILFDFDGVIVDSYAPAFEVHKMKCPHLSDEDYRKRFEGNINEFNLSTEVHTAECRLDLDFFEHYVPKMKSVTVVPGMPEVIANLAEKYTLIVISSTLTMPIQELLDKYALSKYFIEVMGNDVHQSKIEKIKMVFNKYQTDAKSCVFITDTLGDMREASKMNVGSIGVTWGFHTPETLARGSAYKVVDKPEDILVAVNNYFVK